MKNKFLSALLPLTAMGMVMFTAPIRLFLSPYSVDSPDYHEYSFHELSESLPANLPSVPVPADPTDPSDSAPPIKPVPPPEPALTHPPSEPN